MKKNGVKSAILKVPVTINVMSFWGDFFSSLNKEVYGVRMRKTGDSYHYHLSIKHKGLRIPVGPQLVERINFLRDIWSKRGDEISLLQHKNTNQLNQIIQLQRENNSLKAKAQAFTRISNLLNFISGIGPDEVEGIGYVVKYAKDHGLIHKEDIKQPGDPTQTGRTKNGKL